MKTIARIAFSFALAGAALFSVSAAEAKQVTYSNFSLVAPHYQQGGWCISGPASGCSGPYSRAVSFSPNIGGTLDHLDLALSNFGSLSSDLGIGANISLVADNGSGAPKLGPAMEEWNLAKTPLYNVGTFKATHVASKRHPALVFGKTYWIIVSPTTFDDYISWGWNGNNPATTGHTLYSTNGGGTWSSGISDVTPAFDVWIQ